MLQQTQLQTFPARTMSLRDRLSEDLKRAMKDKDQLRMDVIRMMKAAIFNKELELKKELDDADLSRVMTMLVKQRRESVEHYQKANRADLASKELKEIDIIQHYLPQPLSPEDISQTVVRLFRASDQRKRSYHPSTDDQVPCFHRPPPSCTIDLR